MAATVESQPLAVDSESLAAAGPIDDSDTDSYTSSLASSIRNYHFENGRRYHAFREGKWLVPNDDQEQDRMDLLHHWNNMMLEGKLLRFEAEVLKSLGGDDENALSRKRVLDVGTGTGIWAIEFADTFPDSVVIGTDLSPIQPQWVPPNLTFIVEDAESPWQHGQPFNLIHGRNLSGAFTDWPAFYKQCFENLASGGAMEMQDFDFRLYHAQQGAEGVPEAIRSWADTMNEASEKMGRPLDVSHLHVKWMRDAGFEDVQEVVMDAPLGNWPKDARMKQIGLYHVVETIEGIEPYTLAIWTRVLGRNQEEAMKVVEEVKKEIANSKNLLLSKHRFVYGRKPA